MSGAQPQDRILGKAGLGALLFVAGMLFYMISVSPFVDLTGAASTDPAAEHSNLLNQAVFLSLTAGLWSFAVFSPIREEVAQPLPLLGAIAAWFVLVSAMSDYPDLALKRVVLSVLTCVNASIMLLLPRSEARFARLCTLCCLLTLGVAYAGVALLPHLAIHQADEIREPMNAGLWRGHFPHKNTASAAMVLISFLGLYVFGAGRRLAGLAIIGLAIVFLLHAGGKTAIAALPATLIGTWIFRTWRAARLPLTLGGVLAINALTLGAATSPAIRAFIADLGIDPTFTNRTDIWRIGTEAVANRPVTGYGFQLFWQTKEMVYGRAGAESWAVAAFNGHNAYLDAAVTTGLPGLVLTTLFVLGVPLVHVSRLDRRDPRPHLTRLYLNIWLYGLFTGCVESIFFSSGNLLWFLMLVAIFGLRLQARAALIEDAAPARPMPGLLDRIAADLRAWKTSREEGRIVRRRQSLR